MKQGTPTLIGHVDSVKGGVVTIRLRDDVPTFMMVDGHSYRMGQVGAFLRIPLGYTQLYAVCTLVGAAAAPQKEEVAGQTGHRWLSATLFGESIGGIFERGVSQYPTIEDEVHLVSPQDMRVIYGSTKDERAITVGHIAAASGISGNLDLGRLITRHSAVVGSTGSGKSNLLAVLLEAIATQGFPSARILVIDPHGEYGSAVGQYGRVFKIKPDTKKGELPLYVPYWALPFDELQAIALGQMQPGSETAVRDEVTNRKKKAVKHLSDKPPDAAITADAPIPFSLTKLWFDLDDFERQTFKNNERTIRSDKITDGDAEKLIPNRYPAPNPGGREPYAHPRPRNIGKQLELMRSRLQDSRFAFLFQPGDGLLPNLDGKANSDLHSLIQSWIGHDKPLTVLDVSGLPPEVLSTVVGTMIRIVYDLLYWALDLPISGRNQPLLIVLEEAHIFLPEGGDSSAHRTISRIAKEGRKYGVGLCVVTQRPGEIESSVLSQCGTMIALRLTNSADRTKVESAMPDDLGALSGMLPALRTGEGIVLGEAMPIPSRIQFFKARKRPRGDDPEMPEAWRKERPNGDQYKSALNNWRHQADMTGKEKNNA
ncbi:MAG: ATP-binding protein [Proteobacteria bacterium]|nr:ATP-binding protein [Pseudomonadota bacterium]